MENAALYFSGGIQDVYCTEIAKHLTDRSPFKSQFAQQTFAFLQNEIKRVDLVLPNVEELFVIISCAVKRKDLVGAFSTYVSLTEYFCSLIIISFFNYVF